MTWFHRGVEYEKEHQFTRSELLEIRPKDVKAWMANKTYGDPDYKVDRRDRPIHARSAFILYLKKTISLFMPNNNPAWCNGQGNPTKHRSITEFIKEVLKFEVRGEGAKDMPNGLLLLKNFACP